MIFSYIEANVGAIIHYALVPIDHFPIHRVPPSILASIVNWCEDVINRSLPVPCIQHIANYAHQSNQVLHH